MLLLLRLRFTISFHRNAVTVAALIDPSSQLGTSCILPGIVVALSQCFYRS
ncbi:hypothetical protein GQ600_7108 [Phytophthora cactorum]|nr:hypothetical protein GQ600_7108 [Phytophthora cactorum]